MQPAELATLRALISIFSAINPVSSNNSALIASSIVPTKRNASSGNASCLPSKISSKPLIVSLIVTYEPGMQRMTKPLNRGVVQSMMEAANGDPHIFSDMAKRVVKTGNNPVSNVLDDFGVDGQFISAFYGMGG